MGRGLETNASDCGPSTGAFGGASGSLTNSAMLASVLSVDEAKACVDAGVDVIDCKDPSSGALGALEPSIVTAIVSCVDGRVPVSATVGDLPCRVAPIVDAVRRTADLGVDIVKVGLFLDPLVEDSRDGNVRCVIEALGRLDLNGAHLVAVLLADKGLDLDVVDWVAQAGFRGVMVDTADKAAGSLVDVVGARELSRFVSAARSHGVFSGLAGRLRHGHISEVLTFGADIVGFRGALCAGGVRGAGIDGYALAAVRRAMTQTGSQALNLLKGVELSSGSQDRRDVASVRF